MKLKCSDPIYCRYCGARLKKDRIGHYCPSYNCQWRYGVNGGTKEEIKENYKKEYK